LTIPNIREDLKTVSVSSFIDNDGLFQRQLRPQQFDVTGVGRNAEFSFGELNAFNYCVYVVYVTVEWIERTCLVSASFTHRAFVPFLSVLLAVGGGGVSNADNIVKR